MTKLHETSSATPLDPAWLGIVRPHFETNGAEPPLTFGLLGVAFEE
jgi:hypothetical protein